MNYIEEKFPLNHFALWTKGWYEKVHFSSDDQNTRLFEELKSVLALDDYSTNYMDIMDIARIIMNSFENYNKWCQDNNTYYMRLTEFLDNVKRYESYGYGYFESIIMTIRSFIQGSEKRYMKLVPPVYSKELYKKYDLVMGKLLGKHKYGQTYKEMNDYVNSYNW